jgi:sugar phosphate isomerase/epimerase
MMITAKGCYSWRVGATSFVLPAGVEDNVIFLADKVDDIQLLFFESLSQSLLPHNVDVLFLKEKAIEHDLSYTVHLPLDIRAGSDLEKSRQQGVAEIVRLFEMLSPLQPQSFDLHLALEQKLSRQQWLENIDSFLNLLKKEVGSESRVAIENIDYPFADVRNLVLDHGFSLCLDFGHAIFYDDQPEKLLSDISKANHIHYHGIIQGRDHLALTKSQGEFTKRLGAHLSACDFDGVVTLELYKVETLQDSLQQLDADWRMFRKEKRE